METFDQGRTSSKRRCPGARFSCSHRATCVMCDARLQYEKRPCPACRAPRRTMVRLSRDVCPISDNEKREIEWWYDRLTPERANEIFGKLHASNPELFAKSQIYINGSAEPLYFMNVDGMTKHTFDYMVDMMCDSRYHRIPLTN